MLVDGSGCAKYSAGKADLQLGSLSCQGRAQITSGGRVTIDSLDGNAEITAGTESDPADATVHCNDNLRNLSLTARDVHLRLSPSLAEKVVFSVPPGVGVSGLPEGIAQRSKAYSPSGGADEEEVPLTELDVGERSKVSVEVKS